MPSKNYKQLKTKQQVKQNNDCQCLSSNQYQSAFEREYEGWSKYLQQQNEQSSQNILSVLSNNLKSYQNLYKQSNKKNKNQQKFNLKSKHKRCSTLSFQSNGLLTSKMINKKDQTNPDHQQKQKSFNENKENIPQTDYKLNQQKYNSVINQRFVKKFRQNKKVNKNISININSQKCILSEVKFDLNSLNFTDNKFQQKDLLNLGLNIPIQQINKQHSALKQRKESDSNFKICQSYNLTEALDERLKKNRTNIKERSNKPKQNSNIHRRAESETKRKFSCQILKPHEMRFGQNIKVTKNRRDSYVQLFGFKHRKVQLNATLKDFSDSAFFIKQKMDGFRQTKTKQI